MMITKLLHVAVAARNASDSGSFYTTVTALYFAKYGEDMADNEDLKDDTPNPDYVKLTTTSRVMLEGWHNLSDDELKTQQQHFSKVRWVSRYSYMYFEVP